MKDPLDLQERAYEILEISKNASKREIDMAYALQSRTKPTRRNELTQAWHQLRKPEARFEVDFWYYAAAAETREVEGNLQPLEQLEWEPEPPPLEIQPVLPDLEDAGYSRYFKTLEFRECPINYSRSYDAAPAKSLAIPFAR